MIRNKGISFIKKMYLYNVKFIKPEEIISINHEIKSIRIKSRNHEEKRIFKILNYKKPIYLKIS